MTLEEIIAKLHDIAKVHGLGYQMFSNVESIHYDQRDGDLIIESSGSREQQREIDDLEDEIEKLERKIIDLEWQL